MRQVLNGLIYDTDRADVIATKKHYCHHKTLYKTSKGNFFLHSQTKQHIIPDEGPIVVSENLEALTEQEAYVLYIALSDNNPLWFRASHLMRITASGYHMQQVWI